jgi:2-polyprenyl-3-methyl-5-hydroxy-6-metoxy-1,4-benzoquinol methylase
MSPSEIGEADRTSAPETAAVSPAGGEKVTFSFGRNWSDFVAEHLNPAREQRALDSVRRFLEREDLHGLSFLDIGCGSGLFSLAAWRLGASQIVSIDVDPFSVRCCEQLRQRAGQPAHWRIEHGSVLDTAFLGRFEPADVVFAWGSLHHTGQMWQAIRNAAALVKPGGLLDLAIYNRVEGRGSSEYWVKKKKAYNRATPVGKRVRDWLYALRYDVLPQAVRLRNPLRRFREHGKSRGMSYWTDVRDWLGGYPYEYASTQEMFRFCHHELGMELVNLRSTNSLGTNEFLFRRRG